MKQNRSSFFSRIKAVMCLLAAMQFGREADAQTTSFGYTGAVQSYTVPTGVTYVLVDARGASGGNCNISPTPGLGGRVRGYLATTPGSVLNIFVGGAGTDGNSSFAIAAGGYNGGGLASAHGTFGSAGGAGGGATDIRIGGAGLANRVLVAGGGGGAGYESVRLNGGAGGGLVGGAGARTVASTAGGGTQSAGGAGGAYTGYSIGGAGTLGNGGAANPTDPGIAGGGGGYYGGGGATWGGGGGGSSYTDPSLVVGVQHTQGFQTGNGAITLTEIPTTAAGSLNFDGTNDIVTFSSSITNLNNADFTLEAWINTTGVSQSIITCANSNTSWEAGERTFYIDATGKPAFVGNSCGYVPSTVAVNDGTWHHVALTWDYTTGTSGSAKMYIDGIDRTGSVSYVAAVANVGAFYLGRPNFGETGNYFNGAMDEVRIWSRALCRTEILNNMSCELSARQVGLSAYYKFNQGVVASNNSSVTSLTDASGNGNTGTLTNFALSGVISNWFLGNISGSCAAFPPAIAGNTSICLGTPATLTDATTGGTWRSSNTAVATIGSLTGIVSGVTLGTATITYTPTCGIALATVTVSPVPSTPAVTAMGATTFCSGGSVTLAAGGKSMEFSGSNYATVPNYSAIQFGSGASFSATGWVYVNNPAAGTFQCVFSKSRTGSPWYGLFINSAGLWVFGTPTNLVGGAATAGWHHFAIVYNPSGTPRRYLYIDGALSAADNISIGAIGAGDLYFGKSTPSLDPFSGQIDEFVIFNTALSSSTIVANMNKALSPTHPNYSNVVGYWKFDEADGAAITDASGHGAPGTSVGSPARLRSTAPFNDYTGYSFGWSPTGRTNDTLNVTASGSYSVTITSAAGCSAVSGALAVTVNTPPAITSLTNNGPVCAGNDLNFTTVVGTGATPYSYSWSGPSSFTSTISNPAIVSATTAATGIYSLTLTDANGCSPAIATTSATVNSAAGSITGASSLSTAITAPFSASVPGGSWSSSRTAVATVGSTGIVAGVSAGTSIISYTLPSGCYTTAAITIVNPLNGLDFDGTNDYISTGANITDLTHTDFTIEAWVQTTGTSEGIVTKQDNNTSWDAGEKCFYIDASGSPAFVGWGNNYIMSATPVNDGAWHHVAITWEVGTLTGHVYIDGVDRTSMSNYYPASSDYGTVNIGNGNYNGFTPEAPNTFSGKIDEVRMWNVARSQTQIAANMYCDVAQQTNLMGYYRFNEGATGGDNTAMVNAYDYSGSGICGALNNFALTGSSSNFVAGAVGNCNSITLPVPGATTGTPTACVGGTFTLTNGVSGGSWSSSDNAIATVNATSGVVTGIAGGVCTITYSLNCGVAVTTVTINATPVISGSATLCYGATTTYTTSGSGVWSSSDPTVATIGSTSGDITTGSATGAATITFTSTAGCTGVKTITVLPAPWPIIGGSSVCSGTSLSLIDTMGGTWSSSSTGVATIGSVVNIITSTAAINGISAGSAVITYAFGNGCIATKAITVNASPSITSGPASICQGATSTLTASGTGATWNSGNTAVATVGASTGLLTGVSAGTANITLTIAGCRSITTATINALPSAGTLSGATGVTVGATATISSTVTGGAWTSSNTAKATVATGGVVTGVATGTAIISYSVTNGCGVARAFRTITVTPAGLPGITGSTSICLGGTTTLSCSLSGGTWSSSGTMVASVGSTGIVTGNSVGTAVITYRLLSAFTTTTVNVSASLVSPVSGAPSVCAGSVTTFTHTSSGGVWSSSNTAKATVGSATGVVTGISAGAAVISYTTGAGCRVTKSVSVAATPAAITGTPFACAGLTTTLANSLTGGRWTSASPAVATIGSATGIVLGVAAGTSVISYATTSGCSVATTVTINQVLPITGPGRVCVGQNITLASATPGGVWTSTSALIARIGSGTGVVTGVAAASTNVTYSVGLCRVTAPIVVNLSAAITGSTAVCQGLTTTLTNGVSGGVWSSSAPAVASIGSGTGIITGVGAGTATISYTLSSGCVATSNMNVAASPSITSASNVCRGQALTMTASMTGGTWRSNNTLIATIDSNTGVLTGIAAGSTNISYTVGGCRATTSFAVNTISAISGATNILVGQVATLTEVGTGTWSSSVPAVATIGSSSGSVTGVSAGTSVISFVMSTGCSASVTLTVTQLPAITGDSSACVGQSKTLRNSTPGGTWTSGNTTIATIGATSGVVNGITGGTVYITYTFPAGGNVVFPFTVNRLPPLVGPSSVCVGQAITLVNADCCGTFRSPSSTVSVNSLTGSVTGITAGAAVISYTLPTGCIAIATVSVNPFSAITGPNSVCTGDTMTLSNATSGGVWSSSNSLMARIGSTSGFVNGLVAGTLNIYYSVPTTGCRATYPLIVSACRQAAPAAEVAPTALTLMPNPNNGTFMLNGAIAAANDEIIVLEITNMLGQVVYTGNVTAINGQLNQSIQMNATPGMYLLNIRYAKGHEVLHFVIN